MDVQLYEAMRVGDLLGQRIEWARRADALLCVSEKVGRALTGAASRAAAADRDLR